MSLIMNKTFKNSFEKVAFAPGMVDYTGSQMTSQPSAVQAANEQPAQVDNSKRNAIVAGIGAVAAGGMYALMRKAPTKGLTAIQRNAARNGYTKAVIGKKPESGLQRMADKLLHGADEVHYMDPAKTPSKPLKTKATVLHTEEWGDEYVKGKHQIGSGKDKGVKAIADRKDVETKLLDQIEPNRPTTVYPDKKFKKDGFEKLKSAFGDENYFIKGNNDAATGVGGAGFISKKDIDLVTSTPDGWSKLPEAKQKVLKKFLKNPTKFHAQKDMGIEKDLMGNNKEFRIHVVGNKVVNGASSPRSGNIGGILTGEQREAEKYLQTVLKKLPKDYRNTAMAADIAKTKDGFKVIELNAGTAASGFLDPKFMNDTTPIIGGLTAAKNNQAVYKAMTGRDSQLVAGVKGVAAGTAAAGGAIGLEKAHKKIKEKEQAQDNQEATPQSQFAQALS